MTTLKKLALTLAVLFILAFGLPAQAFETIQAFQSGTVFFADPATVENAVYIYDSANLDGTNEENGNYHLREKEDSRFVLITPHGRFQGKAYACYKSINSPAYIEWEAKEGYFAEQATDKARRMCYATAYLYKAE